MLTKSAAKIITNRWLLSIGPIARALLSEITLVPADLV